MVIVPLVEGRGRGVFLVGAEAYKYRSDFGLKTFELYARNRKSTANLVIS